MKIFNNHLYSVMFFSSLYHHKLFDKRRESFTSSDICRAETLCNNKEKKIYNYLPELLTLANIFSYKNRLND